MAAKSCGLEIYESETESARLIETITGSHRFKVEGYSFDKGIGVGRFVTSPTFTIGEYEWAIRYYSDGINEEDKDFLAFFLELKSEATRVKASFDIMLEQRSPPGMSFEDPMTFECKGRILGYRKFIERKTFETSEYLKNNSFVVFCTITIVVKCSFMESKKFRPVIVPPSDLNQQLHYLLKSSEGADVTFEVGEEIFKAHKLILGARSRVFHAQFFGHMKEKQTEHIKPENIEAEVFRVFLDFIYSDSMSKLEETIDALDKQNKINMYQHLLVAADRYEVDRLKSVCENKLAQNIEVKNCATTLTLAEQHNCSQLKASCIHFVTSPDNLVAVMGTEGFEHLNRSCPFVLKELIENSNNNK